MRRREKKLGVFRVEGLGEPGPGLPCSHSAVIALYTCPICRSGVEVSMRNRFQFKTRFCYISEWNVPSQSQHSCTIAPNPPIRLEKAPPPGPGVPCSHSAVIALYTCPIWFEVYVLGLGVRVLCTRQGRDFFALEVEVLMRNQIQS